MKRKAVIVVTFAVGTLAIVLLIACWEPRKRLACCENMKRIGTATRIYANDTQGQQTLEQLIAVGNIPRDRLVCPSSGLEKCNYVLVAFPASDKPIGGRTVIMYEPKSNHGDGGNFLFADGHASFVRGERYDLLARESMHWWGTVDEDE